MTSIAFLGLGHMGLPMAKNLVAAGHDVVGYDVVPAALDAAEEGGLRVAETAAAAVSGVDAVFTMLPTGRHVLEAYAGTGGNPGLLDAAAPNSLFIDCSTIAVEESRKAHDLVVASGHRALDAPVSGGVVGAENRSLAFMVGGKQADFEASVPLLSCLGQRLVHCGGAGLGQAAKVCNNMILAISQIAVAEAFVLGERLGLSHQSLFDVVSNATGQCWALTSNCPVPGPVPTSPANRDFAPGFSSALMSKDLGLAEAAIRHAGVDAQMGSLAHDIYRVFADGPGGARDFSSVIDSLRN